jgi:hypothetical protein
MSAAIYPFIDVENHKEISTPANKSKAPRTVEVSVKINNISDINCVEVTFQISFKLFLRWEDPKLIGLPSGTIIKENGEDWEIPGLFNPDIVIINEFELAEVGKEFRVVDGTTGKVKLSTNYRGKIFMMNMGLKYFPFDAQNLQIILRPHKLDETKLVLSYNREDSASEYHPIHEWRFVGFCAKRYHTDPSTSTAGKVYSSLHIVICVQREYA